MATGKTEAATENPVAAALATALAMAAAAAYAQPVDRMVVEAGKIGAEIRPTMYGHFFEDINYGADGGLYAEMVKNRSFEFPQRLMGWKTFGNVAVEDDGPFDRNPHYVRLTPPDHPHMATGIENEGFFGMGVVQGSEYRFTVWARGKAQSIRVELVDNASMEETQTLAGTDLAIDSEEWKKYELRLTPARTLDKAHLRIFLTSGGTVDLEHVSLFPVDTWKGRENGLRKDLVQALADTRPGVFRFPGGCIVEGTNIETRYNWKNSVGPVENRPLNINRWQYTFRHRFFPDYYQSYGMGFYELFLLAEDIGAEPLPILNCGLACQYQNNSPEAHVAVCDLDPYIDDALDLIEFANGATDTEWGALRAEMGHPEPFNLKYIGIEPLQRRTARGRIPHGRGAQRRRCPHGHIRPAAGPRRGVAVASRPYMVRQPAFGAFVQLARPVPLRQQQGHQCRTPDDGGPPRKRTAGPERALRQRRMGRAFAELHSQGGERIGCAPHAGDSIRGPQTLGLARRRYLHHIPLG